MVIADASVGLKDDATGRMWVPGALPGRRASGPRPVEREGGVDRHRVLGAEEEENGVFGRENVDSGGGGIGGD